MKRKHELSRRKAEAQLQMLKVKQQMEAEQALEGEKQRLEDETNQAKILAQQQAEQAEKQKVEAASRAEAEKKAKAEAESRAAVEKAAAEKAA